MTNLHDENRRLRDYIAILRRQNVQLEANLRLAIKTCTAADEDVQKLIEENGRLQLALHRLEREHGLAVEGE